MLTLHSHNLSNIVRAHGLTAQESTPKKDEFIKNRRALLEKNPGFIDLPLDTKILTEIRTFAKKVKGLYSHIVILGIGGSALGAIAIREALQYPAKKRPELIVLDTIDPVTLEKTFNVLPIKKTLFIVISKSGTTPETLAQYFLVQEKLTKAKRSLQKHLVIITDPTTGFLREESTRLSLPSFSIPTNVGGRFSIFSAVGLLPAALLGHNIIDLILGAKTMRDRFLSENIEENTPYQFAHIQAALYEKQKTIHVLMPYNDALFRVADWYRQLLGESIGKRRSDGTEVGITPVNALGVTDQHSQIQLFNDGPNDKMITMLFPTKTLTDISIPKISKKSAFTYLSGVRFSNLLATEREATITSLVEHDRPVVSLEIDAVNAYTLGELFFFFEASVAYLGELLEVNAFDQPGVERGKILTKEMLQK